MSLSMWDMQIIYTIQMFMKMNSEDLWIKGKTN